MIKLIFFFPLIMLVTIQGCGLFSKKNDSEAIEKLQKYQEEVNKKLDSIKMEDYRELMDSVNNKTIKEIDSLRLKSDS